MFLSKNAFSLAMRDEIETKRFKPDPSLPTIIAADHSTRMMPQTLPRQSSMPRLHQPPVSTQSNVQMPTQQQQQHQHYMMQQQRGSKPQYGQAGMYPHVQPQQQQPQPSGMIGQSGQRMSIARGQTPTGQVMVRIFYRVSQKKPDFSGWFCFGEQKWWGILKRIRIQP